jgi:hypothetical protein
VSCLRNLCFLLATGDLSPTFPSKSSIVLAFLFRPLTTQINFVHGVGF